MSEEDFFQTLVYLCYEANQIRLSHDVFLQQACYKITAELKHKQWDFNHLYNPYKNLSLDKCYGDDKHPLGEYFNPLGAGYD